MQKGNKSKVTNSDLQIKEKLHWVYMFVQASVSFLV